MPNYYCGVGQNKNCQISSVQLLLFFFTTSLIWFESHMRLMILISNDNRFIYSLVVLAFV
jgi:hypothetical protein